MTTWETLPIAEKMGTAPPGWSSRSDRPYTLSFGGTGRSAPRGRFAENPVTIPERS